MNNPNDYQIGGNHYRRSGLQHWDIMAMLHADYFTGCASKYITRLMDKDDPLTNLKKARHFLAKRQTVYKRPPLGYRVRYWWHRQMVSDWLQTLYGPSPIGMLQYRVTRAILTYGECDEWMDHLEKELRVMLEPNVHHTEPQ